MLSIDMSAGDVIPTNLCSLLSRDTRRSRVGFGSMQPCVSARDFTRERRARARTSAREQARQGLPGQIQRCARQREKSSSAGAKIVSSSPRTAEIEAITHAPVVAVDTAAPRAALGSESSEPRPSALGHCVACVGSSGYWMLLHENQTAAATTTTEDSCLSWLPLGLLVAHYASAKADFVESESESSLSLATWGKPDPRRRRRSPPAVRVERITDECSPGAGPRRLARSFTHSSPSALLPWLDDEPVRARSLPTRPSRPAVIHASSSSGSPSLAAAATAEEDEEARFRGTRGRGPEARHFSWASSSRRSYSARQTCCPRPTWAFRVRLRDQGRRGHRRLQQIRLFKVVRLLASRCSRNSIGCTTAAALMIFTQVRHKSWRFY